MVVLAYIGLAVLIYQLLMEGNHPFRAQWLGSGEPPPLEERIRLGCFPYRQTPVCPVAPPTRYSPKWKGKDRVQSFLLCSRRATKKRIIPISDAFIVVHEEDA